MSKPEKPPAFVYVSDHNSYSGGDAGLEFLRQTGPYVGFSQSAALRLNLRGAERGFFDAKLQELARRVAAMPVTYEQKDTDDPVVYLHYFTPSMDFYITEKDMAGGADQAFGWVYPHGLR